MRLRTSTSRRGFTLIETMTVVVIVGVLAALGTYGVRRYIYAAKSGEAREMILHIKAAEETYREETYQYLSTASSLAGPTQLYPHVCLSMSPGARKVAWEQAEGCEAAKAFRTLGVTSTSPVYFGYGVALPVSGGAMPSLPSGTKYSWGTYTSISGPAYVVLAMGDLNGDGTFSKFVGSNLTDEIYSEDDEE
jgi:prepilin-type N-terminal cleavage/methylation domain-containing protein